MLGALHQDIPPVLTPQRQIHSTLLADHFGAYFHITKNYAYIAANLFFSCSPNLLTSHCERRV